MTHTGDFITERDLNELAVFLATEGSGRMYPIACEGFVGVASSPSPIMPSEWLPIALGEEEGATVPASESPEVTKRILTSLIAWSNHLSKTLLGLPEDLILHIGDNRGDASWKVAALWSVGYVRAVGLRVDEWAPFIMSPAGDVMAPLFRLVSCGRSLLRGNRFPSVKAKKAAERLPRAVVDIFDYWYKLRSHMSGT